MAHIFVKNSLSELKAAMVDINFPKLVTKESKGDSIYLLSAETTYPSMSGTKIPPIYIDKVNCTNLDYAIDEAVSTIASQIDWLPLTIDSEAPYIDKFSPSGDDVSIASNIYIEIVDDIPSAGIDLSEMTVVLNTGESNFDITDECKIKGNPLHYRIFWEPKERIQKTYIGE